MPSAASAAVRPVTARPAPHVMTIVMENTDFSQAAGSAQMPYLNQISHQYAAFTQAYGWQYPSLPNYVELMAGSTLGINSDCDPGDKGCTNLTGKLFTNQLEAKHVSWHAFYQDDVSGCDAKSSDFFHGNYDVEHNPFAYQADFSKQCSHISNFASLLPRLSSKNAPDYNLVVPDLDNDGGDNGTMSSGDTWLSTEIPQIMKTRWYRQGGQIVVMYDTGYEDSGGVNGSSGGHIPPLLVISAHTRGMGIRTNRLNTAGVLRSLEQAYRLPLLGDAARKGNGSLANALVAGRPTGRGARRPFAGAIVTTSHNSKLRLRSVKGSLTLNGVYRHADNSTIEVGENARGEGVVVTKAQGTIPVRGTSTLESVSCTTETTCWAVGLATVGSDQGTLVKIVKGLPVSVKREPAWYALYGISCPTSAACEAVGYDTSDIADAVTTITHGVSSAPVEVKGGGEWLNAISCPTATQCYATGLVNFTASVVPIVSGVPQTPVSLPNDWYANAIDCPTAGNCVVAGESANKVDGTVATLVNGAAGTTRLVKGTENLYGVSCTPGGSCLLAGASATSGRSYSHGVVVNYAKGTIGKSRSVPGTNGFGQIACGSSLTDCAAVGAAITK